ncbi:MAG: B12-binding domain-containing radical SAM protein [Bacteroidota bacterium]
MHILLVSPSYPDTYWSFKHALKFISKKANNPPLGLMTVAALLPTRWEKRLVDLNVRPLRDKEILWADYVMVGAMSVQEKSASDVINRCRELNRRVVAGGPLFTGDPDPWSHVDHLVLNEAEITLPHLLSDLEKGQPKKIYRTRDFAEMKASPPPDYSLIDASDYGQLSIQYTRGCPYNCEFCEITALLGRKVRVKSGEQILDELEGIYQTGFRGNVFFVDDNFIGNRYHLKRELLPAITRWNESHRYPFSFTTEASINLADDTALLKQVADAGFNRVFIGIESPNEESLKECDKKLNLERDLLQSVREIQSAGIEVTAGFIVGFDHDTTAVFQNQIDFIQQSGIMTAMVGLLNAPSRTRLYERMKREGRIISTYEGNNTDYSMNFVPVMNRETLLTGYQAILTGIYSNRAYYDRLRRFLKEFKPATRFGRRLNYQSISALLRSILYIGILGRGRIYYWRLFAWSLFRRPQLLPLAITHSIYGYHFRKVFQIER